MCYSLHSLLVFEPSGSCFLISHSNHAGQKHSLTEAGSFTSTEVFRRSVSKTAARKRADYAILLTKKRTSMK